MTANQTPEALADITDRLRKDKWHITGVDAEEAAQTIEDLRDQLAKAKADERHIYQSFSTCDDERRTLSTELAAARAEAATERALSFRDQVAQLEAERDSLRAEVERLSAQTTAPPDVGLTNLQAQALAACLESERVSVSEVQRKLGIGWRESESLCRSLVLAGVVTGLPLAPILTAPPVAEGV